MRVYIDNVRALGDAFDITPAVFEKVGARFPETARRIEAIIGYDNEDFAARAREADVLFAWEFPLLELARLAPRLRWIQLMGAGLDHLLPLTWLPAGVRLATAAGSHHDKAGEVLLTAVLMLNNSIPFFATAQRDGRWEPRFSGQVRGKTVLIVGVGATGGACAQACKAMGLRTIGVRPSRRPHPSIDEMHGVDDLRRVLPQADFVVVAVPLTSRNRSLFGPAEFACFKPGAGLVSIARHDVIDSTAMVDALQSGRLSGAVYDLENPNQVPCNPRMFTTRNLLILPHCLTNDPATFRENVIEVFFRNAAADLAGQALPTQVDPSREY